MFICTNKITITAISNHMKLHYFIRLYQLYKYLSINLINFVINKLKVNRFFNDLGFKSELLKIT